MDVWKPRETATAVTDDHPTWIGTLRRAVSSYFRDNAVRRHLADELTALGSRDLDRILVDIGCSRDELPLLIHNAPRSKPLLDAMILKLGLERAFMTADPGLMREVEHCCGTCTAQAQCGRWLYRSSGGDGYKRFCPNAGNFDILAGRV